MLLNNYSLQNSNPGKTFGGITNPYEWRKGGSMMKFYQGEYSAENYAILKTCSFPNGNSLYYTFMLSRSGGSIASTMGVSGVGDVANINLSGGLNGVSQIDGVGDIQFAQIEYIGVMLSVLAGASGTQFDIIGKVEMVSSLLNSGDLVATLNGAISALSSLDGVGDVTTADIVGSLSAVASIACTGDLLGAIAGAINAIGSITCEGTLTGDLFAIWNMASTIAVSGDLTGDIKALAHLVSEIQANGDLSSDIIAKAFVSAGINVTGDVLTTANIASSIWDAIATQYNTEGTFGAKFNEIDRPFGLIVSDAGNAVNTFKTDLLQIVDNYWTDTLIVFKTGNLAGQVKKVSAYNGTTKQITTSKPFTDIPSADSKFYLINI